MSVNSLLTIDSNGDWTLATEEDKSYRVRVEYSKSSRAKCRHCLKPIEKGLLRIGKPIKWKQWISSWRHLECYYVDDGGGVILDAQVFGFENVEKESEKKDLLVALSNMHPPDVDESLNGNSAEFEAAIKKQSKSIGKRSTPKSMLTMLLPFQQEGLWWMLKQEQSEWFGGLLCDEMGLGKTMQTIALLVADKASKQKMKTGPTLVIAPSSAMHQWHDEISDCTVDGTLRVVVYQGSRRLKLTPAELVDADVVLTSYPILEYEYRKCVNRQKVSCEYCRRKFLPRKLIVHNMYFCGPNSKRTAKLALREKKSENPAVERSTAKAMETLGIVKAGSKDGREAGIRAGKTAEQRASLAKLKVKRKHNLPTPGNIYNELMRSANRKPVAMYISSEKARELATEDEFVSTTSSKAADSVEVSTDKGCFASNDSNETECLADVKLKLLEGQEAEKGIEVVEQVDKSICHSPSDSRKNGKVITSLDSSDSLDSLDEKSIPQSDMMSNYEGNVTDMENLSLFSFGKNFHNFIFRRTPKRWVTNLVISDSAKSHISEFCAVSSRNGGKEPLTYISLVCAEDKSIHVRLHRCGDVDVSCDSGKTWRAWSDAKGRWTIPQEYLLSEEDLLDGWVVFSKAVGAKHIGSVVARVFHGILVIGLVIAFAPKAGKQEALWRVRHCDGDEEDLDRKELFLALNLAKSMRGSIHGFDKEKGNAASSDDSKPLFSIRSSSDLKSFLFDLNDTTPVESRPSSSKKGKNKRKKVETIIVESDDKSDDDDSDFVADDNESSEEDRDSNNLESNLLPVLKQKFYPVSWGPGSFDARLFAGFKLDKKKKSPSGKSKYAPKRKASSAKRSKSSYFSSNKKDDYRVNGKAKRLSDSELSSDCSSSDEEFPELENKGRWEDSYFWYAAKDRVVDDQGVDLGPSLLHCIGWYRIVLDEAHKIKDRVNSTAKATLALRGTVPKTDADDDNPDGGKCFRWCLSGTPLQNRVNDLYSLIRFLRIDPYAFYFCKMSGCSCRNLNWSFGSANRLCENCQHPPMKHYSYFNKMILNPIKRNGYVGEGKYAMKILRDELLGRLMLRRTKAERMDDIKLPPCSVEIRYLAFSDSETDFYEAVYKGTRAKFNNYVEKGTVLHNYAHIFELLSRLRRAADHPYMVLHGASEDSYATLVSKRQLHRSDVCGICRFDIDTLEEVALASCRHTFHKACIQDYFESFDNEDVAENALISKKPSKKRRKGSLGDEDISDGEDLHRDRLKSSSPSCPMCFLPLSITIDLKGGNEGNEASLVSDSDSVIDKCVICMENERDCLLLPCGHLFICMSCSNSLERKICPMCRADISRKLKVEPNTSEAVVEESASLLSSPNQFDAENLKRASALVGRKSILQRLKLSTYMSSTKVDSLVECIQKMIQESQPKDELPNKAIVFSQYTDMLDIVQWRLQCLGIEAVKLTGSVRMEERRSLLDAFRTNMSVSVILMSLKAGGEGLNLQIANFVFVIEPFWNPSVEMQAIQRAHRIGQTRAVQAVRFVTKGTIEEKMMELQEKKTLLFQGAVDGDQASIDRLTEEDLRFLFS